MSATCTILANFQSFLKDINPALCDLSKVLDFRVNLLEKQHDEITQKSVLELKKEKQVEVFIARMEDLLTIRDDTIGLAGDFIKLLDEEIQKINKKIDTNKSALSQKGYNKAGWNLVKGEIQETIASLTKAKDVLTNVAKNYEEGIEEFNEDQRNDKKYITMLQSLSTVKNGTREGNYAHGLPENEKATFPPIPGRGGKRTRRRRYSKRRTLSKRTRRSY